MNSEEQDKRRRNGNCHPTLECRVPEQPHNLRYRYFSVRPRVERLSRCANSARGIASIAQFLRES
jgi:hypothetical protein